MKKILIIFTAMLLAVILASCLDIGVTETSTSDDTSDISDVSQQSSLPDDESAAVSEVSSAQNEINFTGSFGTDYACACNLFADYTISSVGSDEINVTVKARLECRQISISARNNVGKVVIGSETYAFSTPAIENYETQLKTFELVTQSRNISRDDGDMNLRIEVSWPFRGQYLGFDGTLVDIGDMHASGTVNISADGTVTVQK